MIILINASFTLIKEFLRLMSLKIESGSVISNILRKENAYYYWHYYHIKKLSLLPCRVC